MARDLALPEIQVSAETSKLMQQKRTETNNTQNKKGRSRGPFWALPADPQDEVVTETLKLREIKNFRVRADLFIG